MAERPPADFSLTAEETLECPYPFYAAMRRDEPVHRLPGQDVFLLSRWEDIVQAAEQPDRFSATRTPEDAQPARLAFSPDDAPRSEGGLTVAGLSNSDGAEHHFKRQLALRLISPTRLRAFTPRVRELADELIDGFAARGEVEFVRAFAAPLPL